jgi:hypothetical protein
MPSLEDLSPDDLTPEEWAGLPRPPCLDCGGWLGWHPSLCGTCAVYAELINGLALEE